MGCNLFWILDARRKLYPDDLITFFATFVMLMAIFVSIYFKNVVKVSLTSNKT